MTYMLDLLLHAKIHAVQGQDQSMKSVVRYSLVCPLERISGVLVVVTGLLKSSLVESAIYMPGNTSPQVLRYNISVGNLVVHLLFS
jgi:hypothetical protein